VVDDKHKYAYKTKKLGVSNLETTPSKKNLFDK
jgi:hypothetical protein